MGLTRRAHARPVQADNSAWLARENLAERMIPLIGALYRDNGVITSIHGRRLINRSPIEILKAHRFARQAGDHELDPQLTIQVLEALRELRPGPASIDIGRLAHMIEAADISAKTADISRFLQAELASVLNPGHQDPGRPDVDVNIVLYGFGRIGRLLARILLAHSGNPTGLRLRAIVVRNGGTGDLQKRASLLRRDSVHGPFAGTIEVDEDRNIIIANGTPIQVIYSDDPASVDYAAYGIQEAVVVDNTGRWRDEAGLAQHLRSLGVSRVLLTAPGKGPIKNIVHGVNHEAISPEDRIFSAASCTTNAITPVLAALDEAYGVVRGHIETVHSFTNDQNLIDNFHKGDRRGRSAALNMVITETGAAKAVAKAIPHLAGRLTGSAIRVPTPNVSLAILNVELERRTTKAALNAFLRGVSLTSVLRQQVDYVDSREVVSTDFVGSNRAGTVDGLATIVDENHAVLYVWYDNEYGYSCQVIRVLEAMAGVHPVVLPKRQAVRELAAG